MSTDRLLRLARALADPAVLGHPIERVEIIQTHISVVLLTGRFAYKLKKPLALGFIDCSTLERRRHLCEEELRLNRRLAPDLYLEVLAILGSVEEPRLAGAGEPIEYAVRMREFPQQALLDRVLARGGLGADLLAGFAERIAAFHAAAAIAGTGDAFGSAGAVRDQALGAFEQLDDALLGEPTLSAVARLRAHLDAQSSALGADFERRRAAGRVRECHGDLHLTNMLLIDGRIEVFDCIDFNADLRWTDVAAEIAFLAMDLDVRGRADLGTAFLNAWLCATGDYDALAVLGFYRIYRSIIRAKVAALRAAQAQAGGGTDAAAVDRAREHVALAARYAFPAAAPVLIVTHGLSGCGKSWLAARLSAHTGAIWIRSDVERKRLAGLAAGARSGSGIGTGLYGVPMSDRTYARLRDCAAAALRGGFSAIVDATFLERGQRASFARLARDLGVSFGVLWLRAPDAVLADRVAGRAAQAQDPSEADAAVIEFQRLRAEPPDAGETGHTIAVDTAAGIDIAALAARIAAL
ncbi:MAG: AAA family ATPase [Gammaproteobacteria bacterium]